MPTPTPLYREHNFSSDPLFLEIETSLMDGGDPYEPTEENLWCEVNIETVGIGAVIDQMIKLRIPYSQWNKKAKLDISGLLRIRAVPPDATVLNVNPGVIVTGVLDHVREVNVSVADAFGIPLEAQTPVDLDPFFVIKGGTRYYQGLRAGAVDNDAILHNQTNEKGVVVPKEVRKDQPEIICYYVKSAGTVDVRVSFYFKDGDSTSGIVVGSVGAVAGTVNYLQAGWNQLGLDTILDGLDKTADDVYYYRIILFPLDITGDLNHMLYHVDDRVVDRDVYVAFFNGIGGVEVARFSGKHRKRVNASADIAIRTRDANTDFAVGSIIKHNADGHEAYVLNSGYYDRFYCDQLAQMMLGEAWIIDNARKKFYNIYIEATNMETYDEENDLHSVEITYRGAPMTEYSRFRS